MSKYYILCFLSIAWLSACATKTPPPEPDRTNLRPINDSKSLEIIRKKVNQNVQKTK